MLSLLHHSLLASKLNYQSIYETLGYLKQQIIHISVTTTTTTTTAIPVLDGPVGDITQRLCTAAETKFYFSRFLAKNYLKPNINCNVTTWNDGCEPGWACRVEFDDLVDLKNSNGMPTRTTACQPCCAGFFCPRGLTSCPLGSYCPLAELNKTTSMCEPYSYQLPPKQLNHTCGGADSWADISSSSEMFCSAGSYCPSTTKKVPCSDGHYCRTGSRSEKKCFKLTSCDPNTAIQGLRLHGAILIAALSALLIIIYNCSDHVLAIRERRNARSREAAARSVQGTAHALNRWKAARDVAKKHALGLQKSLSSTLSCQRTARQQQKIIILGNAKSEPDEDLKSSKSENRTKKGSATPTEIIDDLEGNFNSNRDFSLENSQKHAPKGKHMHTNSQIFKYVYEKIEKEKAQQQDNKKLTFSGVIKMATQTEFRTRPTIEISFRDLTLTLKGKNKHLMRCVTGKIMPGRVSAVMGPSGAGKTTFLNALAGKATGCKKTGLILINGNDESIHSYKKIIGFVPQDDIVHGNLTVEENLMFSAKCRLSADMPKADKVLIIERVIDSLGLQHVRCSLVGTIENRGISGGQRKRVNVGLEMVMEPSVLILDEPTSGLDSSSSQISKQRLRESKIQAVDFLILFLAGTCLGLLAKVSDENFGATACGVSLHVLFFNNPRSSFMDYYIVLVFLVYCVTGIAYVFAIFLEPGSAQLWSVLVPVVLTLVSTQQTTGFVKFIANLCYPKWVLQAFVISNAESYSGVWLITRCGSLMKRGYDLRNWNRSIIVLFVYGAGSRIVAYILMVALGALLIVFYNCGAYVLTIHEKRNARSRETAARSVKKTTHARIHEREGRKAARDVTKKHALGQQRSLPHTYGQTDASARKPKGIIILGQSRTERDEGVDISRTSQQKLSDEEIANKKIPTNSMGNAHDLEASFNSNQNFSTESSKTHTPMGKHMHTTVQIFKKSYGGKKTGLILINGKNESIHSYKKIIGFVPQDDIVHGNLTVEENLMFSANCRLPADMPKADKVLIFERVIDSLGLHHVRDSLVGTVENRGISGGQRKRVNVGMEMVMEPWLLMLDEPTSGLDSSSSQLLLRALRREALEGVNICTVVHQPSYGLFKMFDDLILLAKGGLMVYNGPVKKVEQYFAGLGVIVPDRVNPPDYFIDLLEGVVPSTSIDIKQLPLRWMLHKGYPIPWDMQLDAEAATFSFRGPDMSTETKHNADVGGAEMRSFAGDFSEDVKSNAEIKWGNFHYNSLILKDLSNRKTPGVFKQYRYYFGRVSKQRLRESKIHAVDFLILFLAGACLALLAKVSDENFGLTALLCKIAALRSFSPDRLIYWRESSSGMSSLAYFLSKDTVDNFNTLVKPVVYLSMFYFFNDPRSSLMDYYTVLVSLVYCVTGIAYVFSIFLEPGAAQLSVLLPVVLTLVSIQQPTKFVKFIANLCYPKWALQAFVISNARR
ncbi:hypothetical protein C5167_033595 [Papaver somniferum]|uniref:ABC transporter domain-containing protein n=1 Tax=Papaver somniferum TaxID=3469 RepID=A0A4Y7KDM9_PAPSO|nr:hypothetical protein C5167_033595 [Papaver somniferum]